MALPMSWETTEHHEEQMVDLVVREALARRSLQKHIPISQVKFLPNGKQILFIASPPDSHGLTICYMNLNQHPELDGRSPLRVWGSPVLDQLKLLLKAREGADPLPVPEWNEAVDFSSFSGLSTKLSKEQILLRERQRGGGQGVTSFTYHAPTSMILFQYGPTLCMAHVPTELSPSELIQPTIVGDTARDSEGTRMQAVFSEDAQFVVFTRGNDIWMTATDPESSEATEIQVTFSPDNFTSGSCDFISQEEFDRYTGFWVNPMTRDFENEESVKCREYSIMYIECDEREVPIISLASENGVESHKWPRAGEKNCLSKMKLAKVIVNHRSSEIISINHFELKTDMKTQYPWMEYVVRAGWTKRESGNEMWIQIMDRAQQRTGVYLYRIDDDFQRISKAKKRDDEKKNDNDDDDDGTLVSGVCLLKSAGTPWINYHDSFYFGKKGAIWLSEADDSGNGYGHLYFVKYPDSSNEFSLRQMKLSDHLKKNGRDEKKRAPKDPREVTLFLESGWGGPIIPVTSGAWCVSIHGFVYQPTHKVILFQSSMDSVLEDHLYAVPFDMDNPKTPPYTSIQRLTQASFNHSLVIDPLGNGFGSISSNISQPNEFRIHLLEYNNNRSGRLVEDTLKVRFELPPSRMNAPVGLHYMIPDLAHVRVDDYLCNAVIFKPDSLVNFPDEEFDYGEDEEERRRHQEIRRHPAIIYVYGGPHVQLIKNEWSRVTGRASIQGWVSMGFIVAIIDGRGSYGRGLKFEGAFKYSMGQFEMRSQIALVNHLVKDLKIADPKRIGMYGYSYGGYMSLMALCQRPDIFKTTIAGAPVVKWELYDTGYTERYMGTPQEHPDAYRYGNVCMHAKQFPDEENRLVIIHGSSDENVHIFNTEALIQSLIKYGKPYKLRLYPDERHGIRKLPNIIYNEKFILNHFLKHL